MKYCSECGNYLLANAKFCHACGTQVLIMPMQICPSCQTENPKQVKFCNHCGFDFQKLSTQAKNLQTTFAFNLNYQAMENFPMQLKACFLTYLNYAIAQDGLQAYENDLQLLFHQSHFRTAYFEEALLIWTGKIEQIISENSFTAVYDIEELLIAAFEKAYHEFLVIYAKAVLPAPLSNDILPYWEATQIPIEKLIKDYLQTPQEKHLLIYNHLIEIPLEALKQAQKQFFFAQSQSDLPIVFIDLSLLQTGAQGLVLTVNGLYWKVPFHMPSQILYKNIESLKYSDKGIYINDKYLHIDKGFNFKLYKLLQILQKKVNK